MSTVLATLGWLAGAVRGANELKGPDFQAAGAPDAEKIGWRLGTQAWTFNRGTFFDAVDKTARLKLKYIEAFPGQKVAENIDDRMGPGMKPAAIEAVRKKLASAGVKLVNFGVTGIPGKARDARKVFDWARTMGIETLVTESDREFLDELCDEYGIGIAFHNHPHSWPPEKVLKHTKGRSRMLGACADTGHWMRRKIKPVDGFRQLKGRIISLHLKDLNAYGRAHDVPWGTGKGDLKAALKQLYAQGFRGVFSIEYEHTFSLADLNACVKFFNEVAREIAASAQTE